LRLPHRQPNSNSLATSLLLLLLLLLLLVARRTVGSECV
jgi:hypothetical protein